MTRTERAGRIRAGITQAVLCVASVAAIADAARAQTAGGWSTVVNTDVRVFSWERTSGNPAGQPNQKGAQIYVPVAIATTGQLGDAWKLELIARTGYVGTSRSADPGDGVYRSASLGTFTDTVAGFTLTHTGIAGFIPFYSLNLNLPTGREALMGDLPITRTDPDLVEVPTFGEGFNHAHTLGANIPLSPTLLLTASAGYTARGAYHRDQGGFGLPIVATERFDPGENMSLSLGLAASLGQLTLNLSVAGSWDTASRVEQVETFRSGRNLLLSGMASYRWDETHTSTLIASLTHSHRNYFLDFFGGLLQEPQNSNSNLTRVAFEHAVVITPVAQVFGTLGLLHRDTNSYDPATLQFVSAKTKLSAGGGIRYTVNDAVALNLKLERFRIDEDSHPGQGLPDQRYLGWSTSLGSTVKF